MKKLIYFVGAMIIALSCEQIQDPIEEVNNTSRLSVTARFETADTKVAFSEESNDIVPVWEIGDQIFGFWDGNTLTYQVASVSGGIASFNLVSGTEPTDGKTVHMIYAPSKSVSDLSAQTLAVDYSTQDGTLANLKNHAYMCATATVSGSALTLTFSNQMAIVCFKQLTDLAASTTYTTLEFSTVGEGSVIKVDGGTLKLVPGSVYGPVSVNGSFTSDASGNLTTPIYLAVPCPSVAVSPSITLKNSTSQRVGFIPSKAMTPGKYYYITTKKLSEPILYDDFESETTGSLPSKWFIKYDGRGDEYQVVVSDVFRNGAKSFKTEGASGWSATLRSKDTDAASFNHSKLVLQAYERVSGIGSGHNGVLGFSNTSGSWGYYLARVDFRNNGIQAFNQGSSLGASYDFGVTPLTDTWYHIRLVCDKEAGTYQVFLNGTLVSGKNTADASDIRDAFPMLNYPITNITIGAGNGDSTVAHYDDVIAYAIE